MTTTKTDFRVIDEVPAAPAKKSYALDNTVADCEVCGRKVSALQAFVIENDTDGEITPEVVDRVLAQYPVEGQS